MTPAVMLQGTGSDVGKSLLVAGLCRVFARRGLSVAPFKPQNMSNNAAATADGGEIGRAQALQARAAGRPATVDMNPVLLKPQSATGAQVVVTGKVLTSVAARDYAALKPELLPRVLASFERLAATADLVIVEGAGSPAEINLRAGDIANMGFARAAGVPVVLVGDIERGGVIASLVGTKAVITPEDAAMVAGFVVNRFRGDVRLFDDGLVEIARRTGWTSLGVVPHFGEADRLPAEDSLALAAPLRQRPGGLTVVVPRLPRIANFDDCDPLRLEPDVSLVFAPLDAPLPDADVVILPGSKSTRGDLAALVAAGWDIDLKAFRRRGGRVIGLCGGYQMLGRKVHDPDGLEGPPGSSDGLGLLDVETTLKAPKVTRQTAGTSTLFGEPLPVSGYRIHMGRTDGLDCARPVAELDSGADGAVSPDGRVMGTYVHGLFCEDAFRAAFLAAEDRPSGLAYEAEVDRVLDLLADHLEAALDCDALYRIARTRTASTA